MKQFQNETSMTVEPEMDYDRIPFDLKVNTRKKNIQPENFIFWIDETVQISVCVCVCVFSSPSL